MQTFLPYPDFFESAKCLDYRRLGKQRVEALQILNILLGKSKTNAWKNHPAVKMWNGYEKALALYKDVCIDEWVRRGFKNNMVYDIDFVSTIKHMVSSGVVPWVAYPQWFGRFDFHSAHRAALLAKDFSYYSQFCWMEKPEIKYKWS